MSDTLFKKLDELAIVYTNYTHEPLFTVEQSLKACSEIPAAGCKNLFLKDSKKNYYLVAAVHNTVINLKKLSKHVNAPELRFASADALKEYLGVTPGSVTLFGIINDTNHAVKVLLDSSLFNYEYVGFHPLINNATTVIASQDINKFIASCGNHAMIIDFNELV